MHAETIYTKTTKGVLAVKNKTTRMPRDLSMVFLAVDGKSTLAELAKKSGLAEGAIPAALKRLISDGYVKIFADGATASGATAKDDDGFDLDFTLPGGVAMLNSEAEQRAKAEIEAKARAEVAARAAIEAKARQDLEA